MYEPTETSVTNARLSPHEDWDEKFDVIILYFSK